jgi:hypothetical protein
MSFDNLGPALDELCTLREQIKALQEREKEISSAFKGAMSGPLAATVVGTVMVEVRQNKGRTSYDTDAMREAGIDLDPYTKTGAPSLTLLVKRVGVAA